MIASTTKLVPPAKSNRAPSAHARRDQRQSKKESPVSLSNLREKAIAKKKSW